MRARTWRVAVVVGLALTLAHACFDLPELEAPAAALAPHGPQKSLLAHFVTKEGILARPELSTQKSRFAYLLCVTDRAWDSVRLLLRNLLDNALRHNLSADGSSPQPVVIDVRGTPEGGALISVRDFGPGVEEAALPHLAEPFYRPDAARERATGGVGLGLYLCKLVAQAHGGTFGVRNAGPGLEVCVRLPG